VDYLKRYKIFENVQKAKSFLNKDFVKEEDKNYIKNLLEKNPNGYIGKLVELYVRDNNDPTQSRYNIDKILKDLKSIKLSKPIEQFKALSNILDDIEISKISLKINKLKKANNIKIKTDRWVSENIYSKDVKSENIDINRFPSSNIKINTITELIKYICNQGGEFNMDYHKDWDILYDDEKYLIYEILSYEGANHCISKSQCLTHITMYDTYKKGGSRFFNLIDKEKLGLSLFFDFNDIYKKFQILRWNDTALFSLEQKDILEIKEGTYNLDDKFSWKVAKSIAIHPIEEYIPKIQKIIDIIPKIDLNL
tara:strand:- start:15780 stop:16706 length:927 start_codon:yes stop_codon:yes gene_type:complete